MDFRQIYDEFYKPVRMFLASMLRDEWAADDLVQETFIKVQKKLYTLRDHSKVKPWIFSIARNICQDHFRRAIPPSPDAIRHEITAEGFQTPLVQIQLEQREMSLCVESKIDLLPESYKEIIVLSERMGLNNQEISEILGIEVSNVKVRLHRARKALKEILEQDCTFEHDERNVMICLPNDDTNEKDYPW
jgi:RNA polymerase sigma-70 factor (ECF subfamily)